MSKGGYFERRPLIWTERIVGVSVTMVRQAHHDKEEAQGLRFVTLSLSKGGYLKRRPLIWTERIVGVSVTMVRQAHHDKEFDKHAMTKGSTS